MAPIKVVDFRPKFEVKFFYVGRPTCWYLSCTSHYYVRRTNHLYISVTYRLQLDRESIFSYWTSRNKASFTDDDTGDELDLRRNKHDREVITCEAEPSLLGDLEASSWKGTAKVTKKRDSQRYSNFR